MSTDLDTLNTLKALNRLRAIREQVDALVAQVVLVTVPAISEVTEPMTAVDTVHIMAELQGLNEVADEVKKTIGKAYDHIRVMVLPTKMDAEGLDSMTVAGVGRVSVTGDIHASTVDKQGAFIWLEENGHGDVIQETVNAGTLKAILRKRLKEGQEIPEALFKVSPFDRASITKA